jgi:hypothetical protein
MRTKVTISDLLDEFWKFLFAVLKAVLLIGTSAVRFAALVVFAISQRALSVSTYARTYVERWSPATPNVFVLHERGQIAVLECGTWRQKTK